MLSEWNSQSVLKPEEELQIAQTLIDRVVEATFCIDARAQILYVNTAFCQMMEYTREELLSMRLENIDLDFELQKWSEQWLTLKQQSALTFKSRYQTKAGQIFLVQVTVNYVETQGKELGCAIACDRTQELVELSLRQYASKAYQVQQQLQREGIGYQNIQTELASSLSLVCSTLESTAYGILALDFQGEFLCYNQKFLEMWGIPPSIHLSREWDRAKAFCESKVKDVEFFRTVVWDKSSPLEQESCDFIELKDGRILAHYSKPQRLENQIVGRVLSIWDVTRYKRTEEALKLNESRFRILAETTEASIFLLHDQRICYVNPAAETLTGYSKKELLNNFDIKRLIKGKKLRQIHKQDGGTCGEYQEMEILTKNGLQRWLACTVGLLDGVLDFSSKPVKLVTAIDITDYKQAESEVRQALEQTKRFSELRERFVSMLSHEFRTPLNVISFSADLLKRHLHQWTEEKNRSYLDLIQLAVQQISELLDEILLYRQAESGKLVCEPRQINLDRFCADIVAQMQLATGNQKSVNFVSHGNCQSAYLDPKLLQHILNNLLSNAIKYSSPGSVVTFELHCQSQEAIFTIKDPGIGIPVVDRQQIFEPFYRGSNVDNIPGTGLGLAIVKTLVDLHSGEISVESVVGIGTTFTVKLPTTYLGEAG
ncbi:PAS domain S-box protein [Scytonema sp. UIC 10036]|uniref:scytonemin biosynthesis sensor histidine kinase n=1 Tax=Scytonema sp. UIC 10036 TaxID=2304196 RepID=UPI0012DAEF79|nr:scytonemin biosynthesis sensor histidine kinase [Scytonema sp. UIC 10036]MUG98805.1 PAS domain S-box protein [Scytonema sp. UIC 10036]